VQVKTNAGHAVAGVMYGKVPGRTVKRAWASSRFLRGGLYERVDVNDRPPTVLCPTCNSNQMIICGGGRNTFLIFPAPTVYGGMESP
jgi:hypothetical protein